MLTCNFVDQTNMVQTVNMTYYPPSSSETGDPFYESPAMQPCKVYFITGIMAIEANSYISPLVQLLPLRHREVLISRCKSITPLSKSTIPQPKTHCTTVSTILMTLFYQNVFQEPRLHFVSMQKSSQGPFNWLTRTFTLGNTSISKFNNI